MQKTTRIFVSIFSMLAMLFAVQPAISAPTPIGIIVYTDVDNTTDDGLCSLREAITNANDDAQTYGDCYTGVGVDTITFAGDYTITLASTLPQVTTQMTINGSGHKVAIDGASTYQILALSSFGNLTLNSLTLQNGYSASLSEAGGIYNQFGTLKIENSLLQSNSGVEAGAVYNSGALTIANSTFYFNTSTIAGGAVSNIGGVVTVNNATFSDNGGVATIFTDGGDCLTEKALILMADGSAKSITEIRVGDQVLSYDFKREEQVVRTVTDVMSFSVNSYYKINGLEVTAEHPFAVGQNLWKKAKVLKVGDRILSANGWTTVTSVERVEQPVQVYNFTVDGVHNYYVSDGEHTYLAHNKMVALDSGQIMLTNSIITRTTGNDCFANGFGYFSGANNLIDEYAGGDCSGISDAAITNLDTSPADNSGYTNTMALLSGSNAIDAGDINTCESSDQRGIDRSQGVQCDIGAFEYLETYHVTENGASNCSSWAQPCALQTALSLAEDGNQVWVAGGIYHPDASDRTVSFVLKNGVTIYGGFAGTESLLSERDPGTNVTILSGDLNGDDSGFTNNSENSYHVVVGSGADSTTILDGFTITGANADGSDPDYYGGGILIISGSPTLKNLTITTNSAYNYGGGIYNNTGSPALTNVTIYYNRLTSGTGIGGGMYNSGGNPSLANVTFSANNSNGVGGGMSNSNGGNPTLTNVTLSGNAASISGGGMSNSGGSPTLVNVIIANSTNGDCLGGLNGASKNNLIEDAANACGLTNGVNGNIIGSDPNLGSLADNGGHTQTHALLPGSPAIDAGDEIYCAIPAALVNNLDQRGFPRPVGAACDIGAFEALLQVWFPIILN